MQCIKQYFTTFLILFLTSFTLFLGFHSTAFAASSSTSYSLFLGWPYVWSNHTQEYYYDDDGWLNVVHSGIKSCSGYYSSYPIAVQENTNGNKYFIFNDAANYNSFAQSSYGSFGCVGYGQKVIGNDSWVSHAKFSTSSIHILRSSTSGGVDVDSIVSMSGVTATTTVSLGNYNGGGYPGSTWSTSTLPVYNGSYYVPSTPPPPADTSTRVISLSPAQDTVINTPTTTLASSVYNQVSTYNKYIISLSYVEPSRNVDLLLSDAVNQQFIFNLATSTSYQYFSTTTEPLLSGRWLVNGVFSNGTDGSNYFTATSSTFIVGTSTTFYSDFVYSTSTKYGKISTGCEEIYASSTASLISKSVCWMGDRIGQTLEYLFVPSGFFIDKYIKLKDDMMDRVPFGYFTRTKELLNSVNASSTAAFEIPIPLSIKNFLFNKIRDMMTIALPVLWVVRMYIRLKDIKI